MSSTPEGRLRATALALDGSGTLYLGGSLSGQARISDVDLESVEEEVFSPFLARIPAP